MIKEGDIIVKYVVNLSRALDNSFNHEVHRKISLNLSKTRCSKFLDSNSGAFKEVFGDTVLYRLYKKACQKEKKVKINTVPFNQSLVILVTAFEILLYDIFRYVVNKNKNLKNKLIDNNEKVPISLIEKYKNGEITFADVVIETKNYNFQNLNSANKAFEWALKKSILSPIRIKGKRDYNLIEKIKKIIELRHKIVHNSYNNNKLTYADLNKVYADFLFAGLFICYKLLAKT